MFVSSGIEAALALALALPSFNFFFFLVYPAAPVTSALSPSRLLILISCGCFILFLAWLVVDVRVSSRHEPSPARSGLTPHMDLIPHLNNQVLLVRDFPSCDYQLRQNCHGSLNSTPPRPTSPLFYSLHFSYVRTTIYLLFSSFLLLLAHSFRKPDQSTTNTNTKIPGLSPLRTGLATLSSLAAE